MGREQEGGSILRKGNSTFQSYRSKKNLRNPGEGQGEVADGLEDQLRNFDYLIIKIKEPPFVEGLLLIISIKTTPAR